MNFTRHLAAATPSDPADAIRAYGDFRVSLGHKPVRRGGALLTQPGDNVKMAKTERPIVSLSLAPHRDAQALRDEVAGLPRFTLCPWSTPVCRNVCVSYAGNGGYPSVGRGRALKTAFAAMHPDHFLALVLDDLAHARRKYDDVAVRLNTFSDIAWEDIFPADIFRQTPAYDYTKAGIYRWERAAAVGYHLTLSATERTTVADIHSWVDRGANAAVVFDTRRKDSLPTEWEGIRVVDGDKTDDRLADPRGVIVGLRGKGRLGRGADKRYANDRVFIRSAS